MSYPSGHIANILVFTAVVGVLLTVLTGQPHWRTRLLVAGMAGSTICAASMIYLGYHWTTDAVAGFALGALIRIGIAPLLATALNPLRGPEDPASAAASRVGNLSGAPADK